MKNLSTLLHALHLDPSRDDEEIPPKGAPPAQCAEQNPTREEYSHRKRTELLLPPSPPGDKAGVTLIIYDLETTGLGKTSELGITELGAIACLYTGDCEWIVIDDYHNYVLPKQKISQGTPNQITREYLVNNGAKPFEAQCMREFTSFVKKHSSRTPAILCGHNAKRYDHRILCHHGWNHSGGRAADTLDWFKDTSPGRNSYSLKNLYQEMFGTGVPAAHNAMPDVHATLRIINAMQITPEICNRLSEPWSCIQARVAKS